MRTLSDLHKETLSILIWLIEARIYGIAVILIFYHIYHRTFKML